MARRQVDDDAAAAAERLVETLAQRRRGVDVVLAFHDHDDDVAGGLVEHDGVGVHTAVHDSRSDAAVTPLAGYREANGRPARRLPGEARFRGRLPNPPGRRTQASGGAALRRAGALRARHALGPAPRARGHARLVGGPEGHPGRSGQERPRRPDRGSPARVPRLPRRDPAGPLRRGDDEDLRPRHVRGAQVARQGGDGHLPRRARARQVRAVPDRRQELDDPPHGPAGGPDARAAAGVRSSRCSRARASCPPATAGRTRSSGTACARSPTSRAAACAWPAAGRATSRRPTRSSRGSAARSARTTRCSTARSSPSRAARRASSACSGG